MNNNMELKKFTEEFHYDSDFVSALTEKEFFFVSGQGEHHEVQNIYTFICQNWNQSISADTGLYYDVILDSRGSNTSEVFHAFKLVLESNKPLTLQLLKDGHIKLYNILCKNGELSEILTPEMIADYLQLPWNVVMKLIDSCELRAFTVNHVSRVTREDLEAYLQDLFLMLKVFDNISLQAYGIFPHGIGE